VGIIYGDITQTSKLTVGGPPPGGLESNVFLLYISGLIYGNIEIYGNLGMLLSGGTSATPTSPLQGFAEAYLFNDMNNVLTGGRIDVGGTIISVS